MAAPDLAIRPRGVGGPVNVLLASDEDVEWTWANTPDGQHYVSGYVIVPRPTKRI